MRHLLLVPALLTLVTVANACVAPPFPEPIPEPVPTPEPLPPECHEPFMIGARMDLVGTVTTLPHDGGLQAITTRNGRVIIPRYRLMAASDGDQVLLRGEIARGDGTSLPGQIFAAHAYQLVGEDTWCGVAYGTDPQPGTAGAIPEIPVCFPSGPCPPCGMIDAPLPRPVEPGHREADTEVLLLHPGHPDWTDTAEAPAIQ